MPIIVEDNRSKLKKRQSYRSQRPDSGETDRLTNRDLNELRRLRMVREKARNEMARKGATREETDRLTNADIKEVNERLSGTGMKYGGMKKKKMKKKKVMKANKGASVKHSMDHPDVIAIAKLKKKDREEFKKEYPILSKLMPTQSDKQIKRSAKRFADYAQTEMAKKRTATEGSFAKGGLVKKGKPKIAKKGWR